MWKKYKTKTYKFKKWQFKINMCQKLYILSLLNKKKKDQLKIFTQKVKKIITSNMLNLKKYKKNSNTFFQKIKKSKLTFNLINNWNQCLHKKKNLK